MKKIKKRNDKTSISINEIRTDSNGRYWAVVLWFGKSSLIAKEYSRDRVIDNHYSDCSGNKGKRFSLNEFSKMRRSP